MQHWRKHWSVRMVEFQVELSLITLSKPKTRGKNVGLCLNLGLKNHFIKVQKLFCRTNRTLNLTLKFGAKKVQLVRDRIRYILYMQILHVNVEFVSDVICKRVANISEIKVLINNREWGLLFLYLHPVGMTSWQNSQCWLGHQTATISQSSPLDCVPQVYPPATSCLLLDWTTEKNRQNNVRQLLMLRTVCSVAWRLWVDDFVTNYIWKDCNYIKYLYYKTDSRDVNVAPSKAQACK